MNPIKCALIERNPGGTPPTLAAIKHSWYAVHVEHVPGTGQWTTWALVADAAAESSPTEADIARRVELLREAAEQWIRPDELREESAFTAELRRVAIRQLLAERVTPATGGR